MTSVVHAVRATILALACCGLWAASGFGQPPAPPAYDRWNKLEPADEMRDYRNALREGVFDDAGKKFLTTIALPQLALPGNLADIDRVRRKMFDRLCVVEQVADPKSVALQGALKTVADFMTALARDGKATPVVRVNAALLVGELRLPGNKPWTPAVPQLVAMLGDEALPPAVRVAAAAGLARHVDADPEARAADVGPALVAIAGAPLAGVDPVAADWLRTRALAMLAKMGAAAPAGTASAAAKLLLDAGRPLDVRVRAAAAAGRCAKAAGDVDVAATAAAIRDLAGAALRATQAAAERRELAEKLAGGGAGAGGGRPGLPMVPAGEPGFEGAEGVSPLAAIHRRDAWRLATLADALAAADGGGLKKVAGPAADSVEQLAVALREWAELLDAEPTAASLEAAIKGLAADQPAAQPQAADGGGTPAAAAPVGDDESPFSPRR